MKEASEMDEKKEGTQTNPSEPKTGPSPENTQIPETNMKNGAEQGGAPSSVSPDQKIDIKTGQFSPISVDNDHVPGQGNISMLMDLELPISVELGRVRMLVRDILELGPGAVVELNKFSGEPVDVYVNRKKFAEGEVVVVDQNFGVRITALVGPNDRLMSLQ